MRGYAIAMTVHVLGIIALFGGFAIQHRAGGLLRKARRHDDARPWAELLVATRTMAPSGAVMLLLSGGYLAATRWPTPPAWLLTAAVAVLVIGVVTLLVVNPREAAIGRAVPAGEGALSAAAVHAIASAMLWSSLSAANGAALGTIWLMTAKPGLVESVLVVAVPAAIGAYVGVRLARSARR